MKNLTNVNLKLASSDSFVNSIPGCFDHLKNKADAQRPHFMERRAANSSMRRIDIKEKSSRSSPPEVVAGDPIVEQAQERFAAWEDALDSLGSDPSLKDLERMINTAPNRAKSLYRYALCIYNEKLGEAMMAWEDSLDSLGPFPNTEDLERLVMQAPMQHNQLVVFAQGVLSQRAFHE